MRIDVENRFETYGLVPWADRKGYEQPFGFGTNVIGVLPGSDADLAIFNVIGDKNVRADVRGRAISVMGKDVERKGLLALVDMLADETLRWQRENMHFMDESYPFFDYPLVRPMRKWYEERAKSETLGQEAENRLKKLTKKDFGKDGEAWRKWIEDNVK